MVLGIYWTAQPRVLDWLILVPIYDTANRKVKRRFGLPYGYIS